MLNKRILSVSYDTRALTLQRALLEPHGYKVDSALGYLEAIVKGHPRAYDLYILGETVSIRDKEKLVIRFRTDCAAPIIAVYQPGDDPTLEGIEYVASNEPDQLLITVDSLLGRKATNVIKDQPIAREVSSPLSQIGAD
jgi:hypothetical protein